jgi:glycine/D-amino acid oxidase-like deaminating enzyme/nitrite reductase/ring-hydroxylating ferredoxin subunit
MASASGPMLDRLSADAETEVVVVGGGVVGLTTALLLAQSGCGVLVVEADRIASGVSGYTTAKITVGHGIIYSQLEQSLSADAARLYAASQLEGLACVRELCQKHAIDCDFESMPNYVSVDTEGELEGLDAELEACRRAGLGVRRVDDVGVVPFPAVGALMLDDQAQLHPRKYLLALGELILAAGGRIFEHSRVTEISGQGPYAIHTDSGVVRARHVVVATHYPIVEQGFFATRIHPKRSYVVAAALGDQAPDGMFINGGSPTRSVRTAPFEGGRRLLLVGGEGHRVGHDDQTDERYGVLERFMGERFKVGETIFRWSTQDNQSVDRLPYIGRVGGEGELYVATGFAGWGMTNGTAAALMIRDAIQGETRAWAPLYELNRRHLAASAKSFLRENTLIAARQVKGASTGTRKTIDELPPGQGAIISADGSDCAVYRDPAGQLHVRSATCTHMGCTVTWNQAESSWDCPCHGSRFAIDGRVLHGPAHEPLADASLEAARAL